MDKNLPANARDIGLLPALGRLHMPQNNYPCATTTEPACCWACESQLLSLYAATTEAYEPRACALQQEKPLQSEAQNLNRGAPARATRESLHKAMRTQWSQN